MDVLAKRKMQASGMVWRAVAVAEGEDSASARTWRKKTKAAK